MPQLCSRLDVRARSLWPALFALALLPVAISASELRNSPIVKAVLENESAVVNIHGRKTVPATNASFSTAEPHGKSTAWARASSATLAAIS
jgi:hypothetical protein